MELGTKIIIIGVDNINKLKLAKKIVEKDDYMSIANTFTTNKELENVINDDYIQYMKQEDINLAYKNNAILYVSTKDFISTGITMDEFYNNNILLMNIKNFNNIPELIFSKYKTLIIWLDTRKHNKETINDDIIETKYLLERLDYTNYMYFLDEDYDDIADIIIEYFSVDDDRKKEILEENL